MNHLLRAAACVSIFLLLTSACGDSEDDTSRPTTSTLACGEGTIASAGVCVPVAVDLPCAAGTIEVDGACVPDENALCGPNTRWVEGRCVPEDPDLVNCGEGTTLDEATGRCAPDVVCGPGTIAVAGECLSERELITVDADAEESDDENDPAFGGTPQALQLPTPGDSFLLTGHIATPEDKNGDGSLNQDIDVYTFEAGRSAFVRVHILQLRAGSFGFEVTGPEDYYRQGPRYEAAPSRTLLLPSNGTYQIRVQPQATLFQTEAGPVGGEDHRYLLVLENLGSLDPEEASFLDVGANELFEGNFRDPRRNLIKLLFPSQTHMRLELEEVGPDIEPVLLVLDDTGHVLQQLPTDQTHFLIGATRANSRWLYLDYISNSGLNDTVKVRGESLSTVSLPELHAGQTVASAEFGEVAPLRQRYFAIDVNLETLQGEATPQGLVVEFRIAHPAFQPALLTALSPDNQTLSTNNGNSLLFYASTTGTYLVEFRNQDESNSQPFADVEVQAFVPQNLGSLNTSTNTQSEAPFSVNAGARTFFTFETTEAATVSVAATGTGPRPSALTLFGTDMKPRVTALGQDLTIARHVFTSMQRRIGMLNNVGASAANGTIELEASAAPTWEADNNASQATADHLGQPATPRLGRIAPGERDFFGIEPDQTSGYEFHLDISDGSHDLHIQLLDGEGRALERGRTTNTGLSAGAVLQADTSYYLMVSNTSLASATYALFADTIEIDATLEAEPNGEAAQATQAPWSADPGTIDVAGTLAQAADVDWFELDLPQATWVTREFLQLGGITATHDGMTVELYQADGVTRIPFEGVALLPAGTSFLRVSMNRTYLQGNSYHIQLRRLSFEELGPIALGQTRSQSGIFTDDALIHGLSFTLADDLPQDQSQAMVAWSSATLTVFDQAGNPVHISADSGQVFGSSQDPSLYNLTLPAGTYFATISSDFGESWDFFLGHLSHTMEQEMPGTTTNNTLAAAEPLGTLVPGVPVHRFGWVGPDDMVDYFTFVISQAGGQQARRVIIEQFQLGEAVADIDLALHDANDIPLDNVSFTPQVIAMDLVPGTYAALATYFHDVGANSGMYLLRIRLAP